MNLVFFLVLTAIVSSPCVQAHEYSHILGKYCSGDDIARYTSLQAAKEACENNIECGCIDDSGCDGTYWYSAKGYGVSSSNVGTCAWTKSKGSMYVLTKKGVLCGDEGYKEIDSEKDCKREAENRGITYKGKETDPSYPKGCYLSGKVYFNTHSVGSRKANASPICIKHGYCLGDFLYSHHGYFRQGYIDKGVVGDKNACACMCIENKDCIAFNFRDNNQKCYVYEDMSSLNEKVDDSISKAYIKKCSEYSDCPDEYDCINGACSSCYDITHSETCSSYLIPTNSCNDHFVKKVCMKSCGHCSGVLG